MRSAIGVTTMLADLDAFVRSLIILLVVLPPFSAHSQTAPANATADPVQQSPSTVPPTIPFSPDLLEALTARTGNTSDRLSSDAKENDGLESSASGSLQTKDTQQSDVSGYCSTLAGTDRHSPALAKVCEFALSVPRKLPDVICERKTKRYWKTRGDQTLFEKASKIDFDDVNHSDEITAQVTYRDGQEYDENFHVDGKPADAAAPWSSGAWSIGEFALSLNTIFAPSSKPELRFHKDEKLHSIPAIVFDFHVSAQNNNLYYLRSADTTWFPEYSGRLWLDKTDFRLLRLERETADMPDKPITRMKTTTDYSLVLLEEGTRMVLPTRADVLICGGYAASESCARNIVTFSQWHKFRATTNIILHPN